jgi:RNA polymerase sigma factor (sigma-70 family)
VIEKTDAELVVLARNGDKDAFGTLITRYQDVINRFALRFVGDTEIVPDLVQEASFQAYHSLPALHDSSRFRSWLLGILWNICQNYIRSQSRARKTLAENTLAENHDVNHNGDAVEKLEAQQLVLGAVESLPPQYKEITLLFYFEQLKIPEVAERLGVSESVVKVRLSRARKQMKAYLLQQDPELLTERGGQKMIKVNIADILKKEIPDEAGQPVMHYIIILKEEKGSRAFPIWIAPPEGYAIAMGLGKFAAKRPQTYNFFAGLLRSINAVIEQVQVVALKEDIFYGTVKIHSGDKTTEVDARPSDAIALAIAAGSPIFVAEEVLAKAGIAVPEKAGELKVRSGLEDILSDVRKSYKNYTQVPRKTKDELGRANKQIIDSVFNRRLS